MFRLRYNGLREYHIIGKNMIFIHLPLLKFHMERFPAADYLNHLAYTFS